MGPTTRRGRTPLLDGRAWQDVRTLVRTVAGRLRPADHERGDVPGWVLVTLMTAGLVIALWAIAGPALEGVFETAVERVTEFG